jgi:hypothetical protein
VKKTPDRRGPEQSKWSCTFVITVVTNVNIQINRDENRRSQLLTVAEGLTRDSILEICLVCSSGRQKQTSFYSIWSVILWQSIVLTDTISQSCPKIYHKINWRRRMKCVFVRKKEHGKIKLRNNGAWEWVPLHHVITPYWVDTDGWWMEFTVSFLKIFGLKFVAHCRKSINGKWILYRRNEKRNLYSVQSNCILIIAK